MADYRKAARRAAQRYGLDPSVFERQIQQESGFDPRALSPAGARGIAQIMPATAKGWGVNPDDPNAALNAAAKNMASYVKKFGSYRNALVAYNAGPARVGGSLPSETRNYIATILGGRTPSTRGVGAKSQRGGTTGGGVRATSTDLKFSPGQAANVAAALMAPSESAPGPPTISAPALPEALTPKGYTPVDVSAPSEQTNQSDLSQKLDALQAVQNQDVPTALSTMSATAKGAREASEPGSKSEPVMKGSQIKELFWQGKGGVNLKNGEPVPQGFVSGHQDHVHVAAGPKTTRELGRVAQKRYGLHVGENPAFGGVNPVHVQNSYHYKNEAIDVSGDAGKMAAFARYVKRYSDARR